MIIHNRNNDTYLLNPPPVADAPAGLENVGEAPKDGPAPNEGLEPKPPSLLPKMLDPPKVGAEPKLGAAPKPAEKTGQFSFKSMIIN